MQLSAKALLKPFTAATNKDPVGADSFPDGNDNNSPPALEDVDVNEEEDDNEEDKEEDVLGELSAEEQDALLEHTVTVCTTLDKVCGYPTQITLFPN